MNEEMEWVILQMAEELDSWGYRGEPSILRSDQESAVQVVKERLAAYREGRSMLEHTPVGESGANGRVEEAGKRVRDHAKTFKDQLEWKTGESWTWMVMWPSGW